MAESAGSYSDRSDIEDNRRRDDKSEDGETEPLIRHGALKGLVTNFCFWGRATEVLILINLIAHLASEEGSCSTFWFFSVGFAGGVLWHLLFIVIPLSGVLRFLKFMRVYSPINSIFILLPAVVTCTVMYFFTFSSCPALRNAVFLCLFPCIFYGVAIWKKESGKEFLWK